MRLLHATLLAVLLGAAAFADTPKKDAAAPSLDQQIAELDALAKLEAAVDVKYKSDKADIAKKKAALTKGIKAHYDAWTVKLTKAGIIGPQPKPPAPKPKPKPDDPPAPARSFRVIFAVESGDTLAPGQVGAIYGVEVENWLLKNCTGGKAGFARRDKDNPVVAGKDLGDIWQAARPSIARTPAVVVERNTKVEIIPVEDTPAKMIAVLDEYLQGKRGN
jgi:hypothetical protein